MSAALQTATLLAGLILALAGVAWTLVFLARKLGVRIPMRLIVGSVVLPLAVLLPWLGPDQLLAPTDFLSHQLVPGAKALDDPTRYELLNDAILQFLPWEMEFRRLIESGSFGLWSDALEGGSSLWTNPQASVLSPVAWIARAFSIEHFFLVKIALNLLICCLGVAVLVRRLGGGWHSGALAGVAAALSGAMMPWALYTHTAAVAWIPWTTLALVVLARAPTPARVGWSAVTICLLLLAGHPEVAFAGGCLGVLAAASLRSKRVGWSRCVLAMVSAAALGFLLAAPAVLPFLGAVAGSQRSGELEDVLVPSLSQMELAPRSWFVDGGHRWLAMALHPNAAGRPFIDPFAGALNWLETSSVYAGLWAVAGSALVCGLWLRRSLVLVGFAAVTGLLAAGFIPALWVARSLPLVSSMAYPRAALVGSVALCVAAGLGFDATRRRAPSLLAWIAVATLCILSIAAGGAENAALSIVVWALIGVALVVGEPAPADRQRWCLLAMAVILLAQLPWAWRLIPTADPAGFYPASETFIDLAKATDSVPAVLPKRVLGTEYLGYPSLLTVYGFHQTRSHNPMAPAGWLRVNRAAFGFSPDAANYFAPVTSLSKPWLDALGVGGLLFSSTGNVKVWGPAQSASGSGRGGLELMSDSGSHQVYRNLGALDRWFVATTWELVSEQDLAQRLPQLGSAQHAFVSGVVGEGFESVRALENSVEPILETVVVRAGAVDLRVDWATPRSQQGFLLATSLAGPSGWSVVARSDDGRRLEIKRTQVHGAFLGAWIPGDAARLQLRFSPPYLRAGLVATLLGLALFGWLVRPRP